MNCIDGKTSISQGLQRNLAETAYCLGPDGGAVGIVEEGGENLLDLGRIVVILLLHKW